ncbi:MAG: HD domain-containing protein [Ruminococcus sp.]|nr:HD domain-containing protein [Ruminococcus sp.]
MPSHVTYAYIRQNPDIREYIRRADLSLSAIGYTEHSFSHVEKVAQTAAMILETLDYSPREVELARIAGFLHDIGNVINRTDHAQSGAVMAFRLLDRLEMPVQEICSIISAIGNHDEGTAQPVDGISAALIIADKTDVRRSRVRNTDFLTFDIHDRVNYAVEYANLHFSEDLRAIILELKIDTEISSVLEYFEIFMERMLLCKRAALFFDRKFKLYINGSNIL